MTQEEKQLLLKDLCARLPYGVKVKNVKNNFDINTFNHNVEEIKFLIEEYDIKPYLRPMSSMTEEELNECVIKSGIADIKCPTIKTFQDRLQHCINWFIADTKEIDWLNVHHFDYRGLIEKGLALEATKDMYK